MQYLWLSRMDLQKAFNLEIEEGRESFAKWYLLSAKYEYQLPVQIYPRFLLDLLIKSSDKQISKIAEETLALSLDHSIAEITSTGSDENISINGLNVIGYARGEFGMGEQVRAVARSCLAAEIPFVVLSDDRVGFHGNGDSSISQWISSKQKYGINVFNINADLMPSIFFRFPKGFFDVGLNIGCWAWELESCPEEFDLALGMIDEVWAISGFVQESFAKRANIPVLNMSRSVSIPDLQKAYTKDYFNIPNDAFVFLYIFDAASFLDRKNS